METAVRWMVTDGATRRAAILGGFTTADSPMAWGLRDQFGSSVVLRPTSPDPSFSRTRMPARPLSHRDDPRPQRRARALSRSGPRPTTDVGGRTVGDDGALEDCEGHGLKPVGLDLQRQG